MELEPKIGWLELKVGWLEPGPEVVAVDVRSGQIQSSIQKHKGLYKEEYNNNKKGTLN